MRAGVVVWQSLHPLGREEMGRDKAEKGEVPKIHLTPAVSEEPGETFYKGYI